jgi:hypothetical protein
MIEYQDKEELADLFRGFNYYQYFKLNVFIVFELPQTIFNLKIFNRKLYRLENMQLKQYTFNKKYLPPPLLKTTTQTKKHNNKIKYTYTCYTLHNSINSFKI